MLLNDLLCDISFTCSGGEEALHTDISDLCYNSAKVSPGCAFVCLCGKTVDGHDFAAQAVQAGAAAVIAQHEVAGLAVPVVLVEDTRLALALMSAALFRHPAKSLKMVGITGTKGKTTTSYMVRSILQAAGIPTGLIGTIGAVIGDTVIPTPNTTPESYDVQRFLRQMVDAGCKAAVMEASSIGLRDRRVAGIFFDVGVFTNFSQDHIGGSEHKNMEEYRDCKTLLFRQCGLGAANCDDGNWQAVTNGCEAVKTFGFSSGAWLRAGNDHLISRPGRLGVQFDFSGALTLTGVEVPIPGRFSVYNALAAAAVGLMLGADGEQIRAGLNAVTVKGRVEPVPVPGGYTLFIDYAHNAVSMENVLETLREYNPARLICLFGAGGNRPRGRRFEMGEASGKLADLSVITSDNPRFEDPLAIIEDIKTGIAKTNGEYTVIPDRREAIAWCLQNARPGDIVVLAGKGHEDYQEICGVKHPMDERIIVAELLREMNLAAGKG